LPSNLCCLKQINSYLFGLPITSQKVYNKPFDIHKSKLVVVEIKFINFGKIYTCFIFPTKLSNISWENDFLEGNTTLGDNCNIKHLNHTLSTNYNGKLFFTIKRPSSYKKFFATHHPYWKVPLQQQKKNCNFWNIWPFSLQVNFQ